MRGGRRVRAARVSAAVVSAAAVAVLASPTPAAGGEGYRYWSLWEQGDGAWTYATQGPGTLRPDDGDVIGFRFVVSEAAGEAPPPRGPADFDAVCGGDGGGGEGARVALVIDFGTAAHAPAGERPPRTRTACAELPGGATVAEVLADVAQPLRYNADGLLCAIDGYPERGCGELTDGDGDDAATAESGAGDDEAGDDGAGDDGDGGGGDGGPVAVAVGITVVGVLATAAVVRSRRRDG